MRPWTSSDRISNVFSLCVFGFFVCRTGENEDSHHITNISCGRQENLRQSFELSGWPETAAEKSYLHRVGSLAGLKIKLRGV